MIDLAVGCICTGPSSRSASPGSDLSSGMLCFIVDGVVGEPDWNLGQLVSLLQQFDAAVIHSRRGKPALVRPAIDDEKTVR